MAGLLEGLGGENTIKDEFGQTQADRRDPIWSGLIRAGLLAVAGGGNLMPDQRAKYLAEAGGALADIPGQMTANRSAAAQQVLRSQQLDEGKRKVADRDRVRAYAQTPEFQEMIKGASGPNKLAIQAAIDTGDMAALNTAIGNLDKTEIGLARAEAARAKLDAAEAERARKAGGLDAAPDRAAHGYLIRAMSDPAFAATPQYAWAHDYLSKPQKLPDGSFTTPIDMSKYPKPTHTGPAAPPVEINPDTPMTEDVIKQIGKDMKVNEDRVVNGVTIQKDNEGTLSWDTGSDTREGNRYRLPIGGKVETLPQMKPPPPGAMTAFEKNTEALDKIETALAEMQKNPEMWLGGAALLPDWLLQRSDPEGQRARDLISDLGSSILHDRSGAALTATELSRLKFIPKATDTGPVLKRKLEDMKKWVEEKTRGYYETVGRDTKLPSAVRQRYGKPTAQGPTKKEPDDYKPDGSPLWRHKDGQYYTVPE